MTTINIEELKYIIKTTPANQNIMLVGKHGIGKSEILTECYKQKGIPVIPLFLGQMSDPGDIIGLPNKNEETGITEFMPPYWFPVNGKPIALFLDELNRARPEILQVVQDLVLNRKIAGKSLPEGSYIISAINAGDEYTLTDIDPALLSRFNVYNFVPTVIEWIEWATATNVAPVVVDFISSHKEMLDPKYNATTDSTDKSIDRRSWKRVSDFINANPFEHCSGDEMNMWRKAIGGMIGNTACSTFFEFVKEGNMLSPEMVLTDFEHCVGRLNNFDTLRLMTMTMRICSYINTVDPIHHPDIKNSLAKGLLTYIKYLMGGRCNSFERKASRENAQYFIGEFESGLYPNLSAFINGVPELDEYVYKIIDDAEC